AEEKTREKAKAARSHNERRNTVRRKGCRKLPPPTARPAKKITTGTETISASAPSRVSEPDEARESGIASATLQIAPAEETQEEKSAIPLFLEESPRNAALRNQVGQFTRSWNAVGARNAVGTASIAVVYDSRRRSR
ncbi:unnamed protein product, partial [Ixodes persulcatus]